MKQTNRNRPASARGALTSLLYWGAVLVLFLIVHFTGDRIIQWAGLLPFTAGSDLSKPKSELILLYLPSLKGAFFLGCLAILSLPVWKDLQRKPEATDSDRITGPILAALAAAVLLGFFVFHPGNQSMGSDYARISRNPFTTQSGLFNTRLLMPALAHILFLRGNWLYYAFSMLLTAGFLALLYSWIRNRAPLAFWQFVALGTCSFVIYQYQSAGYPDILVFIFFLLVMYENLGQSAKLSLLLLALITYESSVFVGIVLAWRYLNRRNFALYLAALAAYVLAWFGAAGFDLTVLLTSHAVIGESSLAWLMRAPRLELLGVFIAFKALWVLILAAVILAVRKNRISDAVFISACLLAGGVMAVLAVDTSRLMGYAFPGLLVALSLLREGLPEKTVNRLFSAVFLVQLIVPSFYVGLNIGIVWTPGLYALIYHAIPHPIGN